MKRLRWPEIVAPPEKNAAPRPWTQRLLWLLAIWGASVLVVLTVGWLLRWVVV